MKDSYAKQASLIVNKYKIRLGKDFDKDDTLARQGLELEMNRLKEKQESDKFDTEFTNEFNTFENGGDINIKPSKVGTFTTAAKKRGLGVQAFASKVLANKENYSPEMVKKANFAKNAASWKKKMGGSLLPKYDGTQPYSSQLDRGDENFIDPEIEALINTYRADRNINQSMNEMNNDLNMSVPLKATSIRVPTTTSDMKKFSDTSVNNLQSSDRLSPVTQDKLYEPTLSAVPLAASILGNALLLGDNEAENIKYDRVKPELISLAREREAARRRADFSRNASKRTARGLGLSGGAAAIVANAADVDIDRGLGEQIGKSYLNEELSNKEAINRSKMMNAEIGMREKDANLREKDSVKNTKTAAIQGIIGNVGDYFADTNKARQYNDLTQMMSDDYAYYEQPGQTTFDKIFSGTRKTKKYTGTYNG